MHWQSENHTYNCTLFMLQNQGLFTTNKYGLNKICQLMFPLSLHKIAYSEKNLSFIQIMLRLLINNFI